MKRKAFVLFFLCLLLVATMLVHVQNTLPKRDVLTKEVAEAPKQRIVETYGKLPLSFEANQGQTAPEVKFISRGPGYNLFLNSTEAVLSLSSPQSSQRAQRMTSNFLSASSAPSAVNDPNPKSVALRMKLVGANPHPEVAGLEELPGRSNYFIGNDPSKWRTNVPTYAKVQYKDVYPGVDLVYYGNQRQLEYDLIVAPGADPEVIQLAFEGEHHLEIDAQGDLVLSTAGGQVRLHKPLVYQQVDSVRREIAGSYVLSGERQVGFQVAAYDASQPLVIDPALSYSTYLGGSGDDWGLSIAVDASGNAYVTGQTESTDFPTASPIQPAFGGGNFNAFVTKLNASGSVLVYSTYLSGSFGASGSSIAVDAAGNAYVTGVTGSNFPTANPIQATHGGGSDAFVTKLNGAGNALLYSTYLGGNGSDGGLGIAVDTSGNAYVTGGTMSTDFPTASPIQPAYGGRGDAFVTKLNAAGNALVYSTYLGGTGDDLGTGVAADASGNAYVTGQTLSDDFPTVSPIQPARGGDRDVFLTKLNAQGSALVYSTYLGGGGTDSDSSIAVDGAGNAYVTGGTGSPDFPTANAIQANCVFFSPRGGCDDAFLIKLNATGSALVYSTHLGGSENDIGFGIAVDASGNVYVTGQTESSNFPTASPIQPAHGGGRFDAFVTKLNAAGSALVYSTYLGGSESDIGFGIAVDASGNTYVAGLTDSTDFPTVNGIEPLSPFSPFSPRDAIIAKITDQLPEVPSAILPPDSVVNGASFRAATEPNSAIAPGAIVAIFGMGLATDTLLAGEVPLPTTLGDTSVAFNDIPAPLFFVSGTQINAQVPFELITGSGPTSVPVRRGSETSVAQPSAIAPVSPGIFTLNQQGTGAGAILHAEDFQPVSDSAPARPGEFLLIFCSGLGPVQPEVPSGDVAPTAEPLARTVSPPMVNIAGIAADVTFSGLAPGFVGLYQVNVQVPGGVPSGSQDVEIIINGVSSNIVTVPVSP